MVKAESDIYDESEALEASGGGKNSKQQNTDEGERNMKRHDLHRSFLSVLLAGAPVLSALFINVPAANAQGQSGTTLSAEKTATGFWTRTYAWGISKAALPGTLDLLVGQQGVISYSIVVTKGDSTDRWFVSGTITVTNGGDATTENLQIVDQVEYKIGSGQFQDLAGASQTIIPAQLAPHETKAYDYKVEFTPVAGASYKNVAHITITNHSGHLGTPFGPEPKADFSLPASPTLLNDQVSVSDVETIPAGLTLVSTDEPSWPQVISASTTFSFTKTIRGDSAGTYVVADTATVTGNTGVLGSASASVAVTVTSLQVFKPGDYTTYTQGGWGSTPKGNNPGTILANNFGATYPTGVTVGGNFTMNFTSAADVDKYLPAGGTPDALTTNLINPISSSSGVFGGQVLALQLNVAGITPGGPVGSLKLCNTGTSLDGQTIAQILAAANTALGGGALPAGYKISTLNALIDNLNKAFDNGVPTMWAQVYLCK